ncbi:MAG TPA: TIGR00341 family protein [Candidatus Paceibacterota bacterium]
MSFFAHFRNVSDADKGKAIEKLIKDSTPDYDFFLMITLSILMATAGLLLDSTAVVIGSMLIAPVLYPILSLSLGMVIADHKLISRSIYTILKSFAIGIVAAIIVTLLFMPVANVIPFEILLRVNLSLLAFVVSIISGIAVSVALVRPDLNATLPGVAVSVALMPPLATIGIGIAWLNWHIVTGSIVFLTFNIIGIVFSSLASFSLLNLYVKRGVAQETIAKEEDRVQKEEARVKEVKAEDTSSPTS